MTEQNNNSTPLARKRRPGQKPSAEERARIQDVFLQSFSLTANVRAACLKAGIDRRTIYEWAEHDQGFSMRYEIAKKDADDLIRAELFRRGVQGYEKPVISMGKMVLDKDGKPMMERVYSDNLLSLLAKARMPEFREKQQIAITQHSNEQEALLAQHMTSDELDAMSAIMERACARKAEAERVR